MTPILVICVLFGLQAGSEDVPKGERKDAWRDDVTLRLPEDLDTKRRVTRAVDWLEDHLVSVDLPADKFTLRVIAWKDPTLEPANQKLLAGYLITDTLWSAKALRLFDPVASREIESGLQRLGWYGNGLHDVLFHPIDKILHRPADQDHVHGFSLGRFPVTNDRVVNLRVFRQEWDARFDEGHPTLFAEHAIYRALHDFWQGRREQARRRILGVIEDQRINRHRDNIFWDEQSGVLVDYVNYEDWVAFRRGNKAVCRHYTFKLGVLLYAVRLLGMEREIGPRLGGMKQRLWDAQTESGGVAHFVDVRADRGMTRGRQPTGESSAIAILAEVVAPSLIAADHLDHHKADGPFARRGCDGDSGTNPL